MENKANELRVSLKRSEFMGAINEGRIKSLLDSLAIKPKRVVSYKTVTSERVVHDTLYDIMLMADTSCCRQYSFADTCVSASIDLSGTHPTFEANISNEFVDICYTERQRLFGIRRAPRWGKKETYQTIVSLCGDTIKNNVKVGTTAKPR